MGATGIRRWGTASDHAAAAATAVGRHLNSFSSRLRLRSRYSDPVSGSHAVYTTRYLVPHIHIHILVVASLSLSLLLSLSPLHFPHTRNPLTTSRLTIYPQLYTIILPSIIRSLLTARIIWAIEILRFAGVAYSHVRLALYMRGYNTGITTHIDISILLVMYTYIEYIYRYMYIYVSKV